MKQLALKFLQITITKENNLFQYLSKRRTTCSRMKLDLTILPDLLKQTFA